jgi:hypothetical protein
MSGCFECACPCPYEPATLLVQASLDGGVVDNVEASIAELSATGGRVECAPADNATRCALAGGLEPGVYALHVVAPGYMTEDFRVTLTVAGGNPGHACNCQGPTLSPNSFTLRAVPGDGGVGDGGP